MAVLTSDDLQDEMNRIGFGKFQMLVLFLCGGIMFSEGSEMMVMGSITTLLHDHWELTPFIRGLMVSVVFIGFCLGNVMSGMIGDRLGRRVSILVSYAMIGFFGILTAYASNALSMLMLRFFVGVGCGIGFPSVYSLIPEVSPVAYRGSLSTLLIGCMPIGEAFAALGVLFIDPHLNKSPDHCEIYGSPEEAGTMVTPLDFQGQSPGIVDPEQTQSLIWHTFFRRHECSWRMLCEFSALPAFVFMVFSYAMLPESPHYLLRHEKYKQLKTTFEQLSKYNGVRVKPEFMKMLDNMIAEQQRFGTGSFSAVGAVPSAKTTTMGGVLSILNSSAYRGTACFLFFCHFAKDFSVFGLSYVFPSYFKSLETMTPAVGLIILSLLSLPGVAGAFFMTKNPNIGHRSSLQAFAGLCAASTLCMFGIMPQIVSSIAANVVKFSALGFFVITVVITAEIFPTAVRNSAVGICTGVGRIGSISAPLVFELSHANSGGSFDLFFGVLISSMLFIVLFARVLIRKETKNSKLADDVDESQDLSKLRGGVKKETYYGTQP